MPKVMPPVLLPIIHWCLLTGILTTAGAIFGWCSGMALAALSGDYVVEPSDHLSLGLRAGLFSGAAAAAWQVITKQKPLGLRESFKTLMAIILSAGGVICLLLLLATLLSTLHAGLLKDANLAHPRRHVIFIVMHHAWPAAWVAGIILGGWLLWRKRAGLRAG